MPVYQKPKTTRAQRAQMLVEIIVYMGNYYLHWTVVFTECACTKNDACAAGSARLFFFLAQLLVEILQRTFHGVYVTVHITT
jgi:hypothetical protein